MGEAAPAKESGLGKYKCSTGQFLYCSYPLVFLLSSFPTITASPALSLVTTWIIYKLQSHAAIFPQPLLKPIIFLCHMFYTSFLLDWNFCRFRPSSLRSLRCWLPRSDQICLLDFFMYQVMLQWSQLSTHLGLLFGQGQLCREGSNCVLSANITGAREWMFQHVKETWAGHLQHALCTMQAKLYTASGPVHFPSFYLKHLSSCCFNGQLFPTVHWESYLLPFERHHCQPSHLDLIVIFHTMPVFSTC